MQDVIVVGGGISGLVCAYQLKRLGRNVLLIDGSNRVGGVMKSESVDGFLFERGPNSFYITPEISELLDTIGISPYLVTADSSAPRFVYYKGKLRAVPVPTSPLKFLSSFLTTRLLSPLAKLRLFAEPFIAPSTSGQEQTIEEFITRRFGKQFHDVLVSSFVSGVYAGNTSELSAMASPPFSKLADLEAEHGSVIRGAFRSKKSASAKTGEPPRRSHQSCSFLNGLETLPKALHKALVNELLLNCKIHSIEFHNHAPQAHYTLEVEFCGDRQPIHTASLIIATPAYTAARLLDPLSDKLANTLDQIPYPPLASVALAFKESQLKLQPGTSLQGFGFLIPRSEGVRTLGCIWNSSLFPERAPQGYVTLTCFIGGSTDPEVLALSDDDIIRTVHKDLQQTLGVTGAPRVLGVTRWERAIPQYTLGHPSRRTEIEEQVGRYPGLYLTGNYLYGVSIGDCIGQAQRTAEQVEEFLERTIPPSTGVNQYPRTGSDLLL